MSSFFDKDKIKESLTVEDIKTILFDLGAGDPAPSSNSNELHFKTVCHGGDSYKLYYYINSKKFMCYTGCGTGPCDIFEIVIRARRVQGIIITFPQAVKYCASITNNMFYSDVNSLQSQRIDDWVWINRLKAIKKHGSIPQQAEISEHILEIFCPYPHEAWLKEGISRDSMKKYQISYWVKENKIIIPHRDVNGRLIGIRGRALNQEDLRKKQKYMPITIEGKTLAHKLGSNLYGLCQNEEAIKRMGKLIIFESEKSVLLCDTFYKQNNFSVAVCGSSLTTTQFLLIRNLGIKEVMIAFDKEYKDASSRIAEVYENKILKIANKLTPFFTVYVLWDTQGLLEYKDSPTDKGKEILEKLMKSKIEIKTNQKGN